MRLNKKRLAALAMSAVMAASAVPFPVYAEELSAGDVVVAEEATVEVPEVGAASEKVLSDIVISEYNWKTGAVKAEFVWSDGSREAVDKKYIAVDGPHAADCKNAKRVNVTVSAFDKTKTVQFTTGNAVGHKPEYEITATIKEPTCTEEGKATVIYKCATCEEPLTGLNPTEYPSTITLPKLGHEFTGDVVYTAVSNILLDEDGKIVLGKDGKPQLANISKPGTYYAQHKCARFDSCNTLEAQSADTLVTIPAEEAVYAAIDADSKENVKNFDFGTYLKGKGFEIVNGPTDELWWVVKNPTAIFPIATEDIKLDDCSKPGSYKIAYYDSEYNFISEEKFTVEAHHYQPAKTAVFKTKADAEMANIEYKDGELVVTSKSCYLPVEYNEVTYCTTDQKCDTTTKYDDDTFTWYMSGAVATNAYKQNQVIKTEVKTAEAKGAHHYNTEAEKKINALIKAGNVKYSELKKIADAKDSFVKLSVVPDVCEKGGKTTVSYICIVDKETVVKTTDVTVIAEGHVEGKAQTENRVNPTCEHGGKMDTVVYCTVCNKELSRTTKVLGRLPHTNENVVGDLDHSKDETTFAKFVGNKVVDNAGDLVKKFAEGKVNITVGNAIGTGKDTNFLVQPTLYTNCKECNNHEVVVKNGTKDFEYVKVVDIQKEDSKGQNGYIVLEVKFERPTKEGTEKVKTVSAKIPYYSSMDAYNGRVEDSVLNGLHKDDDGVYRYYVNGELQKDYTGMIEDKGEKYLVVSGVLATDINGLWYSDADKVWYFFVEGHVLANHTGMTLYDGEWFYVSNGKLDDGVTGLVPYNGGTFLFTDGRLRNDVNGLWQDINNPEDWYFLALGQVQNLYSGVAQYDGAFFVVKNGKLDTNYNGTIKYDGETFKVVNGQLITK